MRRLGLAAGAGLLVLLGTACGATGTQTPAGAPQTLPIVTSGPVPNAQLDASALTEGYPRSVSVQGGDGRTLAVRAQEGGCGKADAEVGEQSAAKVVITLVETQPAGQVACTMDIRYPTRTVTLDEPLGTRTVVLRAEQRTG